MGSDNHGDPLDLEALCDLGRFDVAEKRLHGAKGSLQALLFPRPRNRFTIIVDPEPPGGWSLVAPEIRSDLHEHRLRFLVCHEAAHSFFFDRDGDRPAATVANSEAQEEFCDSFASELLVPRAGLDDLPATAETVVDLHRRYRVSVEAAARALAGKRPDLRISIYVQNPQAQLLQWSNCLETCSDRDRNSNHDSSCPWGPGQSVVHLAARRQTVVVA